MPRGVAKQLKKKKKATKRKVATGYSLSNLVWKQVAGKEEKGTADKA